MPGIRSARVIGLEKEFVWTLGAHEVRGMIDRVDQGPDGAYELIDYKTGPDAPTPAQVAAVETELAEWMAAFGYEKAPPVVTGYTLNVGSFTLRT